MKILSILSKLILVIFALSLLSFAQLTSTSGTVQDPSGQTWNVGTYRIEFVQAPNNTGPYTLNGAAFTQLFTGALNGGGAFSQAIADNNVILPRQSSWRFTFCPNATSGCLVIQTAVSGGAQSITSNISAAITNPVVYALPVIARSYKDAEVQTGPGGIWLDVTLNVLKYIDANGVITVVGSGGGGGGTNATSIQSNPVTTGLITIPGQTYVANQTATAITLQTKPYIDIRDCPNVFTDGTTDSGPGILACILAQPSHKFVFPKTGHTPDYKSSVSFNTNSLGNNGANGLHLQGEGSCTFTDNCTTIQLTTGGLDAIYFQNSSCQGCKIEHLRILGVEPSYSLTGNVGDLILPCSPPVSQSYSAGTTCATMGVGVHISSNFVTLDDVVVSSFGKAGVEVDGTGATCANNCADNAGIYNATAKGNRGDGFYIHGGDSNAGSLMQTHAYYNQLYGYEDQSFLGDLEQSNESHTNSLRGSSTGSNVGITNIVDSSGTVTVTTGTANGFKVGNCFVVSTTTNYNGSACVATVTDATHFTYAKAGTIGAEVSGIARLMSANEFFAFTVANAGPYRSDSLNNTRVFTEAYCESDNGGQNVLSNRNLFIGGGQALTGTAPCLIDQAAFLGVIPFINQMGTNFDNVLQPNDAALVMFRIAGKTVDEPIEYRILDHTGSNSIWWLGTGPQSSVQHWIVGEQSITSPVDFGCIVNTNCRIDIKTGDYMRLYSMGTAAVEFNNNPFVGSSSTGTGGVKFYQGGGQPHALIASIDNNGLGTFAGGLTVSAGSVTIPVTGSTQCLQVNSSGVISGTASGCSSLSGGATNVIPLWTGASSLAQSHLTDNGTVVTSTLPVTVNVSGAPTISFTQSSACSNSTPGVNTICTDSGVFKASFGNTTPVQFITQADVNALSGVAGLNASGLVPISRIVANTTLCDATHSPNGDNTACIAVGGASTGNGILSKQDVTSAIVGTAADADVYIFNIPGGTVGAGQCINANVAFKHTTGTATVTYKWKLAGAAFGSTPGTANASDAVWSLRVCNNNGVTNAQWASAPVIMLGTGTLTGSVSNNTLAVDFSVNQNLEFTMNTPATDQVTGKGFSLIRER